MAGGPSSPQGIYAPPHTLECHGTSPDVKILSNIGTRRWVELHPDGTVWKVDNKIWPGEVAAMKVAAEVPGVRVPRFLGTRTVAVDKSPKECIMMSQVSGRPLSEVWPGLNKSEKRKMAQRLGNVVRAIRAVPQPPKEAGRIMSCDGGPIRSFVPRTIGSIRGGPFDDEAALNDWIVSRLTRAPLAMRAAFEETLSMKTHSVVFTHGDLNLSNIMVTGEDDNLVVLDWGHAGWLPDWAEYVRFLTYTHQGTDDIADYADEIFEKPYAREMVDWLALSYYLC